MIHNGRQRQGERYPERQPARILPFILPDTRPRCLWCDDRFTPVKPNQTFCTRAHSRAACERRKAALIWAVREQLERHGAAPETALTKAADVVEVYYAKGRIQRCMGLLGWQYDEHDRMWKEGAKSK